MKNFTTSYTYKDAGKNMPYATFKLDRKLHKIRGATFELVASGVQTVLCDYVCTGQNTVKGVYREYYANLATGEKARVTYHPCDGIAKFN